MTKQEISFYDKSQVDALLEDKVDESELSDYVKGAKSEYGNTYSKDENGNIIVPLGGVNVAGVCRITGNYGINIHSNGQISTYGASNANIEAQTDAYKPITSDKISKAVLEGLSNNKLTPTAEQQASMRTFIGITDPPVKTVKSQGGVDYVDANGDAVIPYGYAGVPGLLAPHYSFGTTAQNGIIILQKAEDSEIINKNTQYHPIMASSVDLAVKVGLTTNALTLSAAEQAAFKSWMGITASGATLTDNGTYFTLNL